MSSFLFSQNDDAIIRDQKELQRLREAVRAAAKEEWLQPEEKKTPTEESVVKENGVTENQLLPDEAIEASIYLMKESQITSPEITLGDIALIETEKSDIDRQLRLLPVSTMNWKKGSKIISSYEVKSLLKKQGYDRVRVYGLKSRVSLAKRLVEEEELRSVILSWLHENVLPDTQIALDSLRLSRKWSIPQSENIIFKVGTRYKPSLSSSANLVIYALHDDQVISKAYLKVDLTMQRQAFVVNKPIEKGDRISPTSISLEWVNLSQLRGMEAIEEDQIVSMVAKKNLPLNHVITTTDLIPPILISKGSFNRITVMNQGVEMQLSGAIALEDGRKNDLILFENPLNKKAPLRAKVIDEGQAHLIIQ